MEALQKKLVKNAAENDNQQMTNATKSMSSKVSEDRAEKLIRKCCNKHLGKKLSKTIIVEGNEKSRILCRYFHFIPDSTNPLLENDLVILPGL